jgi:crotonobetainyl-CoA:carnitine CoA-transferase CaiB-like acyl-CoA transferase
MGAGPTGQRQVSWPHAEANDGRLLAGVKVLDLSRVLAGPYCAMVLADLGADVVKVEGPTGDQTRGWGPPFVGNSATYFYGTNRNKWGVALDLTAADDRDALASLVEQADVVIQNFTGRVAKKLSVDYESVRAINPSVVYLALTGFGIEDPDRRGYDVVAQALTGMMAITGERHRPPAKVGVAISDLSAAMFGATGIVSGLYARALHGRGANLDVSLYDATLALMANQTANWLLAGEETERMGSEHPSITPYGAYRCKGGSIVLAVGTDGQFNALCGVLGAGELARQPEFRDNAARIAHRDELRGRLEERLAGRSSEEWSALLETAGVPHAVVRTVGEALQAPETRSLAHADGAGPGASAQVMGAIRVDGAYQRPYLAPPGIGEHTDAVLNRREQT